MKYSHYIIKRKIEDFFIFPFVLIGRCIAAVKRPAKAYETFFFFPFYHTGGAEKVHALVSQALGNHNSIIYFTRKSADKNFYNEFVRSGCKIRIIADYTDNKFLYMLNLVYRGIISGYINQQKQKPVVFNGQCNFGYKLSPWINRDIPQVELIHSFNTFSWIRLPFLPFYNRTIMISKVRVEDHLRQYKKLGVPAAFAAKIQHIVNGIPLPEERVKKNVDGILQLLYVGRGTPEKRVHIVAAIARACAEQKLLVAVSIMGDVEGAIPSGLLPYCNLLGHQDDPLVIEKVYNKTHVLIITSDTEGFPMVVEEAMARGCAIIATPVGDLPVHITHGNNGYLFSSIQDEQLIVKEAVEFLTLLCSNRQLLKNISHRNEAYADDHFGIAAFREKYRNLFDQLRTSH